MIGKISALDVGMAKTNYTQSKQLEDTKKFADILNKKVAKKNSASTSHQVEETKESVAEKKMRDACRGFEELFLEMMYKEMRSTIPENTLFGKSQGEKIWQSMLDSEMMKEVAKTGGLGLQDLIYQDLKLKENTQAK